MSRILKSFRLTPAAVTSLSRLASHLALSRSRVLELLLVGEITPSRISPDDLCRRNPPQRVQEIRELVRLARVLGGMIHPDTGGTTDTDLKELIQRVFRLIERLDAEWASAPQSGRRP